MPFRVKVTSSDVTGAVPDLVQVDVVVPQSHVPVEAEPLLGVFCCLEKLNVALVRSYTFVLSVVKCSPVPLPKRI